MRTYNFSRLSDTALLRKLAVQLARERINMAVVLALIAEVDARRLYLPAGFPSMFAYCVSELNLSDDAAYKRIQAARVARRFPALFTAVAEGRLHLTGLGLLAPHITAANVNELLAAATHKTKAQIEQLVAARFPRTELLPLVQAIPGGPPLPSSQLAPAQVGAAVAQRVGATTDRLAPAQVEPRAPRPKVAPVSSASFALQFTIGQATHDKLLYAQALLSHRLPSGDIAQVFDRALDLLIAQLEKRKFAATARPRPGTRRSSANPRYIPAHVKRAVWERDQGQCTFVGDTGRRCQARKFLEFDHLDPVARGGQATVDNLQLRCRGHNQYEAERTFGSGFMSAKLEEARSAAAARARATAAVAAAHAPTRHAEPEASTQAPEAEGCSQALAAQQVEDVRACLRELGFRASEARRAVEFCETIPAATLEERVRAALQFLCPRPRFRGRAETSQLGTTMFLEHAR